MSPSVKRLAAGSLGLLLTILPATLAVAAVPVVVSFSPASGPVGTVVVITGTGFTGGLAVRFNGISSQSFAFLTDTQVTAAVPSGATTGPISVVTPDGTAFSLSNFTVTSDGSNVVDCAADPSALQPAIDAAGSGTSLHLSGTCVGNFVITKNLALIGAPATLDAQATGTTLTITSGRVRLDGLKITGGANSGILNNGVLTVNRSIVVGNAATVGGGIRNNGNLTVWGSLVARNSATNGGGVVNFGTLSMRATTIGENAATFDGGGIFNVAGMLTIANSTLSGNSASDPNGGGGGIYNGASSESPVSITNSTLSRNLATYGGGIINTGAVTMKSTTVSANAALSGGGIFNGNSGSVVGSSTLFTSINAANAGGDCAGLGKASSNGYNLVGADCAFSSIGDRTVADTPQAVGIGPLAYHGGFTLTMALFTSSPAKDAIAVGGVGADGVTPACPQSGTLDQRGVTRPQGVACDIGAFERKHASDL